MTLPIHDHCDSDAENVPNSPLSTSSVLSEPSYTELLLPFEIIELIIDELAADGDKESLRAFSLASHTFLHRCQTKLFHTIDLGDRCIPGELYYRRLQRVLSQRPQFRNSIRVLRLVDSYVWDTKTDCKWLANEESICDLLDRLPKLEKFSLSFNTGKPSWNSLKPSIRHALMKLTERPELQAFCLGHIHGFPPAHLVALAAVKHLTLVDLAIPSMPLSNNADIDILLGIDNPTTRAQLAEENRCRIETLSISDPSPATIHALSRLFSTQENSSLRCLKVGLPGEARTDLVHSLWEIVKWSSQCLTHLEWRTAIRPSTPALRPPSPIDLSIIRSLRSLHFVVNFHSSINPVFAHLISMLTEVQVSSRSSFEVLTIECMFLNTAELVACGSDWALLDSVLSGVGGEANVDLERAVNGGSHRFNPLGAAFNAHPTYTHTAFNAYSSPLNNQDIGHSTYFPSLPALSDSTRTPRPRSFQLSSTPKLQNFSPEPNPQFPALHTIIFSARIKTIRGLKESARAILQEQLPGCRKRGVKLMFGWEGV